MASITGGETKAEVNLTIKSRRKNNKNLDDQKSTQSTDEECKTFHDESPRNDKDQFLHFQEDSEGTNSKVKNRLQGTLSHSEKSSEGSESAGMAEGAIRRRSIDKREAAKHYNMPPRLTGVVVKFSPQRGYGFIRPDYDFSNGGNARKLPDVFVHRTSIVSDCKLPNLRVGQKAEYDVTIDQRTGKPHAVNVTVTAVPEDSIDNDMKLPNKQSERMAISFPIRKKCKKQWSSTVSTPKHKMGRMTPIKTMPNQSLPPKAKRPDKWVGSRVFDGKQNCRSAWDAVNESERKGKRMDFRGDLDMKVTIDNELPKHVASYYKSDPHMHSNWPHYHQDYPHQMNYHYDMHHPHNYANHHDTVDYAGRDCAVMGPVRSNAGEYDDYSRREYWYCDQEKHMAQYNDDYRNSMAYDYRLHQTLDGYRQNQQW